MSGSVASSSAPIELTSAQSGGPTASLYTDAERLRRLRWWRVEIQLVTGAVLEPLVPRPVGQLGFAGRQRPELLGQPVDHLPTVPDPIQQLAAQTLERGDVVAQIPDSILEVMHRIAGEAQGGEILPCVIRPIDGDLPAEQQDAVIQPGSRRKIILATNVAETSLTIEGVTGVVDSGLARRLRYDPAIGLDRLELTPISRASADQRAGRAGRTEAGVCLRLWPEAAHRSREEFESPEIQRVDLAGAILQVLCWIEPDLSVFPWYERPASAALERANTLLQRLGAAASSGVTGLGRQIAGLPVHPRIGRLLIEAQQRACAAEAALAAAILSERNPFLRRERQPGHVPAMAMNPMLRSPTGYEIRSPSAKPPALPGGHRTMNARPTMWSMGIWPRPNRESRECSRLSPITNT